MAQSDQNGTFSKVPDIKTNLEDYKKWLDQPENKKYALEFFKEAQPYTDKAIKSLMQGVKKAKGKLGGNLTEFDWKHQIDEFAKKRYYHKTIKSG